jgi:hypothetical protein
MVSLLVATTALEIRRAMADERPMGRKRYGVDVRVSGKTKARGRDLETTLIHEGIAAKNERLVSA